jgi:hypothetical protein
MFKAFLPPLEREENLPLKAKKIIFFANIGTTPKVLPHCLSAWLQSLNYMSLIV